MVPVSLCYLPSLTGQFIRDDHDLIEKNTYIREFQPISSYFKQEDGVIKRMEGAHTGYYRPLSNITYGLDFKIWGLDARGFRTTNVILHLLTCAMLFLVLSKQSGAGWSAVISSLIFGLHPVNTESVSFISARNNILASLFSLASLYFYANGDSKKSVPKRLLSVLCFAIALFSKEFAAVMLPIYFVYDRFVSKERLGLVRQAAKFAPYIAVFVIYLVARTGATEGFLFPEPQESLVMRLLFVPYLVIYNLRLVFFPAALHSFTVKQPASLICPEILIGLLGVAMVGFLLYRFRPNRVAVFAFLCFLMGLIPVLNLIPHSATSLVSMRWIYFPLAFLSMSFPWMLGYLRGTLSKQMMAVTVLMLLSGYSFYLNWHHWHDDLSLYKREVEIFNNTSYAVALAKEYQDRGDSHQSWKYYRLALSNHPQEVSGYTGYASLLIEDNRPGAALALLKKAERLKMTVQERGEFLNNKGMALLGLGENEQAMACLKEAAKTDPMNGEISANLGAAYGKSHQYGEALQVLEKGLEFDPTSIQVIKNLAVTYLKMKDYQKVIETLEKVPGQQRQRDGSIQELLRTAMERLAKSPGAR